MLQLEGKGMRTTIRSIQRIEEEEYRIILSLIDIFRVFGFYLKGKTFKLVFQMKIFRKF